MPNRVARWADVEKRVRAIAAAPPFTAWHVQAVRRLAVASAVVKHRRGEHIASRGDRLDVVYVVVEGVVSVSLSAATGRTVVVGTIGPGAAVFGVGAFVDGGEMINDVVADADDRRLSSAC